jgi:hypothetical protein
VPITKSQISSRRVCHLRSELPISAKGAQRLQTQPMPTRCNPRSRGSPQRVRQPLRTPERATSGRLWGGHGASLQGFRTLKPPKSTRARLAPATTTKRRQRQLPVRELPSGRGGALSSPITPQCRATFAAYHFHMVLSWPPGDRQAICLISVMQLS